MPQQSNADQQTLLHDQRTSGNREPPLADSLSLGPTWTSESWEEHQWGMDHPQGDLSTPSWKAWTQSQSLKSINLTYKEGIIYSTLLTLEPAMPSQEKKKRRKIQFSRPIKSLSSPEKEEPNQNLEEVETLLELPNRKELPHFTQRKPGRKCKLYDLVLHSPDTYARLITYIKSGVSFNVAAAAIGIAERTFYEWGEKGSVDFEAEKDTYFSRFYRDVRKAVATATADCEMSVKELDPRKWLAHGPGRIFGGSWSDNMSRGPNYDPNKNPAPQIQYIDVPFKALPAPINIETGNSSSPEKTKEALSLEVPKDLEYEAFKVLENIGCITMSEEFKQAFDQQQSTPLPTQALSNSDDEIEIEIED